MKTIYNADFNEYQRLMFVEALEHLIQRAPDVLSEQPGDDTVIIPEGSMLEEAKMLVAMLKDIPNHNEVGLTHGLCL